MSLAASGLGDDEPDLIIYVAMAPPLGNSPVVFHPAARGELHSIGQACGNGWRKIFNVYAKLVFALKDIGMDLTQGAERWQDYREQTLLQAGSGTALVFGAPRPCYRPQAVEIIAGRQHARTMDALAPLGLVWLDPAFAVNQSERLVVSPFLDYRQLSNAKIERLAQIMVDLATPQ
ncbi:hypothetical protein HMF8227_01112 [Saliniradius amylolyticus]|uniref:Uncharacterized protein n=1 Tax=Saliniradius amylolyticus TaxID=2183582 RepID=A0A2S2E1S5_9ALTE|nr:hypothetical protein [Saliniradius amylolyticus]AWL11593.1 hypothetical protein HMF8227_01112 [Saliniradius amylolyticus]